MTEAEWLACNDPRPMLDFLEVMGSERRLRLFNYACCRRIWHLITDERSRKTIEMSLRYAEGLVSRAELRDAHAGATEACEEYGNVEMQLPAIAVALEAVYVATRDSEYNAEQCSFCVVEAIGLEAMSKATDDSGVRRTESRWQCDCLRDIFGNPFRPVALNPAWQTPPVVALAQAAYDNRILPAGTLEPARLAVLADALEEAGCDNADIVNHLRQPGEHVRGCWVTDLLLGKA